MLPGTLAGAESDRPCAAVAAAALGDSLLFASADGGAELSVSALSVPTGQLQTLRCFDSRLCQHVCWGLKYVLRPKPEPNHKDFTSKLHSVGSPCIFKQHERTAVSMPPCRLQWFRCLAARVPAVGVAELRRRRPFQHPGVIAVLGMAGRRRRDGAGQARAAHVADGCCSRWCRQPMVNSSPHPDALRELVHCCSNTCFAASCCAKSLPVPAANASFHIHLPSAPEYDCQNVARSFEALPPLPFPGAAVALSFMSIGAGLQRLLAAACGAAGTVVWSEVCASGVEWSGCGVCLLAHQRQRLRLDMMADWRGGGSSRDDAPSSSAVAVAQSASATTLIRTLRAAGDWRRLGASGAHACGSAARLGARVRAAWVARVAAHCFRLPAGCGFRQVRCRNDRNFNVL